MHFTDIVPVATVRGGLVYIDVGSGHPEVVCRVSTARAFCETAIRALDAWEVSQRRRVLPFEKEG